MTDPVSAAAAFADELDGARALVQTADRLHASGATSFDERGS